MEPSYENSINKDNESESVDYNFNRSDEVEEEEIDEAELLDEADEGIGFFAKIKKGLSKTRDQFSQGLTNLFTRNVKIDDDLYEELEEILISADIGMKSTLEIVDELRDEIKKEVLKKQIKFIQSYKK